MFISKKRKMILSKIDLMKSYDFIDAIKILKSLPSAKFKNSYESIDVDVILDFDIKNKNQLIKSSVFFPCGSGKINKIAVFSDSVDNNELISAGASKVGLFDLIEIVKRDVTLFDIYLSSPNVMSHVSTLGSILGPRNLMPNPKFGTVSSNLLDLVKKFKSGEVLYKSDKYGIVHCSIGRLNFDVLDLKQNFESLLVDIKKFKFSGFKNLQIKKLKISTTMGPGISVNLFSLTF